MRDAPDIIERLTDLLGPNGVIVDEPTMAPYLVDWRALYGGPALAVARPATTEEVSAVVRLCAEAGVSVVPQGGNTGLVGGAAPLAHGRQIVLSLGRMNRIRALDPVDYTMTVEAGCILKDLQDAAVAADRFFPLSLGAEGTCQIGGTIATNAGGMNVLRYGNARDLVLGLEAVLPDGRVWNGLRRLRKDNTGYDLKHLLIGSEGTLAVITAAVLHLFPRPVETATALLAVPKVAAALEVFTHLRADSGDLLSSAELMPRTGIELALANVAGATFPLELTHAFHLLVQLASSRRGSDLSEILEATLAQALEENLVLDGTIAASQGQADALWFLREAIVEGQRLHGVQIKHDVSVPVSRIPVFIERATRAVETALPGTLVVAFGHIGDGNIHFNLSPPPGADDATFLERGAALTRLVHDTAADLDGSISAEHGLGQLKRLEIRRYKPGLEMELMERIKRSFDPADLINPGKVV